MARLTVSVLLANLGAAHISKGIRRTGFKDLRNFNPAMLRKQGWRLMEKPDSLCAHVLKGRYYHEGGFLKGHAGGMLVTHGGQSLQAVMYYPKK